jgi:hypothetical protein
VRHRARPTAGCARCTDAATSRSTRGCSRPRAIAVSAAVPNRDRRKVVPLHGGIGERTEAFPAQPFGKRGRRGTAETVPATSPARMSVGLSAFPSQVSSGSRSSDAATGGLSARALGRGYRGSNGPCLRVPMSIMSGLPACPVAHDHAGHEPEQPAEHSRRENDPDERGVGRADDPVKLDGVRVGGDQCDQDDEQRDEHACPRVETRPLAVSTRPAARAPLRLALLGRAGFDQASPKPGPVV